MNPLMRCCQKTAGACGQYSRSWISAADNCQAGGVHGPNVEEESPAVLANSLPCMWRRIPLATVTPLTTSLTYAQTGPGELPR
jgi:hypothetical protein